MSKNISFIPAYYEWHLVDENGKVLYNLVDPGEDCYEEDGETPLTKDEIKCWIDFDIQCELDRYADNAPDYPNQNLLVQPDELPDNAADVMAQALYDYYVA